MGKTPNISEILALKNTRKDFSKLKRTQSNDLLKTKIIPLITSFNNSDFANNYNLAISAAELSNKSDLKEPLEPIVRFREKIHKSKAKLSVADACYMKDQAYISDLNYQMTRETLNRIDGYGPVWPALSTVENYRSRVNAEIASTFKIVSDEIVFSDPKNTIEQHLDFFLREHPEQDKIWIKYSIDGTPVGKSSMTNFVFTIINDSDLCKSIRGNHSLGINEAPETYEALKQPIGLMMEAIESFNGFFKNIPIEFFFCSDMKVQLLSTGLKSASSSYPCQYCEVPKHELHKIKVRAIWRSKTRAALALGSRCKHGKCKRPSSSKFYGFAYCANETCICKAKKGRISKYICKEKECFKTKGYAKKSLLTFISLKNCPPDTLHLRLRVFGRLEKLLMKKLYQLDNCKGSQFLDEKKHINIFKWVNFLKEECKLKKATRSIFTKDKDASATSSLDGDEIKQVLNKCDLEKLFPEIENIHTIQLIWLAFADIDKSLSEGNISANDLRNKTHNFLQLFLRVYPCKYVTPYIHIMVNHVHEFVDLLGNLSLFTCQGLENKNKKTKQTFHRASNFKGSLKQIVMRDFRMNNYEFKNFTHNEIVQKLKKQRGINKRVPSFSNLQNLDEKIKRCLESNVIEMEIEEANISTANDLIEIPMDQPTGSNEQDYIRSHAFQLQLCIDSCQTIGKESELDIMTINSFLYLLK